MVSNKDRLYVGLYARSGAAKMPGREDTYHWALIVGPKDENPASRGHRIHAKDTLVGSQNQVWVFEDFESSMQATGQLLIRILVGKIKDRDRVFTALRNVPVVQDDPNWNCVIWVKEALATLQRDGKTMGTSKLDWQEVRETAMRYCHKKIDGHRFDGKTKVDMLKPATFDILENREIIP